MRNRAGGIIITSELLIRCKLMSNVCGISNPIVSRAGENGFSDRYVKKAARDPLIATAFGTEFNAVRARTLLVSLCKVDFHVAHVISGKVSRETRLGKPEKPSPHTLSATEVFNLIVDRLIRANAKAAALLQHSAA